MSALFFCALAVSNVAHARQYTDEERFIVPGYENAIGADNVTIKPISSSEIPNELAAKLEEALGGCVEGASQLSDLKFFSYESDFNRKHEIYPNIVVDFSGFTGRNMKTCHQTYVPCGEKTCALLGYVYNKGSSSWELGFSVQALSWGFGVRKADGKKNTVDTTYISVLSDSPSCDDRGGKIVDDHCAQNYVWRGEGLDLLH
ncbi:MAG: hypothetical protein ABTQ34_09315 [Bdellovibrionales bacterium]